MKLKSLLLIPVLACSLALSAYAFEPECIVVCSGTDFNPVNRLLSDGWTVKAQSSFATKRGGQANSGRDSEPMHVFTMTPPSELLKQQIAERKADEFKAKREAWLKAQPSYNVEAGK